MTMWMVTIAVQAPDDYDENGVQKMVEVVLTKDKVPFYAVIAVGNMDEVRRLNAEAEVRRQAGER